MTSSPSPWVIESAHTPAAPGSTGLGAASPYDATEVRRFLEANHLPYPCLTAELPRTFTFGARP